MSAPIPTSEPGRLVAGDTAKWLKSLGDYPASAGWVLTYSVVNSAQRYTVSGVSAGDDHLVVASAATTAAWVPGEYSWRAQVSLAGETFTVAEGRLTIAAAYSAATDGRSRARRSLDAVEAMLEGRASSAVAEYTINGRALKYIPVPELLALRGRLRTEVTREDDAARSSAGLAPRGRIVVRFGP